MDEQRNNDALISEFCDVTGAKPEKAVEYLSANEGNLQAAASAYLADMEEEAEGGGAAGAPSQPAVDPAYTGPRTLDGRPAPQAASAGSSSRPAPKKKGLQTFSSLGGGSHSHDDEDEEDDDESDDGRGDLFAGGEKSGLAVQDPKQGGGGGAKKIISDILARATADSQRGGSDAGPSAGPSRSNFFRGSGFTVGGDGAESREIPDPRGNPIPRHTTEPNQRSELRVFHLWENGFSFDDGPLYRFDDPANRVAIDMIRRGQAPTHLINVPPGSEIEIKVEQHNEEYRALPKLYRPFGGAGHRLGSPVPSEGTATPVAAAPPSGSSLAPAPAPSSSSSSSGGPASVDGSQPTLQIRVQMPDGSRLPARFNTTHTVGDLYEFVRYASPATTSTGRDWVIATTFPNQEHTDKALTLGDMAEFKRGGTAVVKWA